MHCGQLGVRNYLKDHLSGVKASRPGLNSALNRARAGDILVVWRLDRLGRSLKDLIQLTETLKERSIGLHSLQEAINTTSSSGQLVFHLFGALAEFERNLIRERTKAGLTAARARGRTGGRPKALDHNKRQLAVKLYNDRQHSIDEICKMMGISKPTLYNYVAEGQTE
jgi:DNA invertase Pin-like site-specific DNA recombinase